MPDLVRRMHEPGSWAGCFSIRWGRGGAARLLARLLRFPFPAESALTRLVVTPRGQELSWKRSFDGKPLESSQRALPGGLVAERFGAVECQFRLRGDARGVTYEHARTRVRLGRLSLPWPRPVAPRVTARVESDPASGSVSVNVCLCAPFVGEVLAYEGEVRPEVIPA